MVLRDKVRAVACYGTNDYRLEYVNTGRIMVDKIVTHEFPLSGFKRAFKYSEKGLKDVIKIVLYDQYSQWRS